MLSSGINLILLWSVPTENRDMSVALTVLFIHIFGDVPSPILIGYFTDRTSVVTALRITLGFLSFTTLGLVLIYFCFPRDNFQEENDSEDHDSFDDVYTYHPV